MAKGKPDQNWKEKLFAWKTSGKSTKTWCKENNIPYTTLLGWRKRFECTYKNNPPIKNSPIIAKSSSSGFIELKDSTPVTSGVFLEYHGIKICLQQGFSSAVLKECLNCLEGIVC